MLDDDVSPARNSETPDDIPAGQLVCDLHYEKSWDLRRRFTKACRDVTKDTLPCTGTYACICKHSDKEYYRASKTLSVIPLDYSGLSTKLYDAYKEPEIVKEEEEGEDDVLKWALIVGGSIAGIIILCCAGYYLMYYCANRVHKVSYMEEYEN